MIHFFFLKFRKTDISMNNLHLFNKTLSESRIWESQIMESTEIDLPFEEPQSWLGIRYVVIKKYTKSGPYSQVYLCVKRNTGCEVVVKEITINGGEQEFNQKLAELVIMMKLCHPSIVSINGKYYMMLGEKLKNKAF